MITKFVKNENYFGYNIKHKYVLFKNIETFFGTVMTPGLLQKYQKTVRAIAGVVLFLAVFLLNM